MGTNLHYQKDLILMLKKIISFSLWGTNLKYVDGAIKNAILATTIYPDWICRFYIGQSTIIGLPEKINTLRCFQNVEIIEINEEGDWKGMFWRFYPCSDNDVDILISRDSDSRLSFREKAAVDEWLNSKKDFHIMRDHHGHGTPILGGMWGARNHLLFSMKKLIDNYTIENYWQIDQEFLRNIIYPIVKENAFVHDPFFEGYPFPVIRNDFEFVGDVYDEQDNRNLLFKKELEEYLKKNRFLLKFKRVKNYLKRMIHTK